MSGTILVGFSTVYGSTQEVAEFIAATLHEDGFEVDIKPLRAIRSLAEVRAVVIGAPLYIMRWHKDARSFLSRYQKTLETLPVATFALGPFHNKEEELTSAQQQLEKELEKYSWLSPVATGVFVGKFDPDKLHFPYNLIGPLKKMPACDERNWEDIQNWAHGLALKLQPTQN